MSNNREIDACMVLPAMLRAARLTAGLQQKAAASDAGLDQSYLCAVERGRKPVPRREVLTALTRSLRLDSAAQQEVMWAAAHDRLLWALKRERLPSHARLLSAALRAAHCLSEDERIGLETTVNRSLASKQHLLALQAEALKPGTAEEVTMT